MFCIFLLLFLFPSSTCQAFRPLRTFVNATPVAAARCGLFRVVLSSRGWCWLCSAVCGSPAEENGADDETGEGASWRGWGVRSADEKRKNEKRTQKEECQKNEKKHRSAERRAGGSVVGKRRKKRGVRPSAVGRIQAVTETKEARHARSENDTYSEDERAGRGRRREGGEGRDEEQTAKGKEDKGAQRGRMGKGELRGRWTR